MKGEVITVVGLGLMGGSLAAALGQADADFELRGVDSNPLVVAQAAEQGIVDEATTDLADGVDGATIVVLATPVRTIIELIGRLGSLLGEGCLLLDLGSTKAAVIEAMTTLPAHIEAIGGHPLCGREVSGLTAADPAMYRDKVIVLCPLPRTRAVALERAEALVRAVGARPLLMDPARHDRLIATTSHLPYLLATSLIAAAEEMAAHDDLLWEVVASGFRDTSRLAASNVTVMTDILMTNRAAVGEALRSCQAHLDRLVAWIENGDETALREAMRRGKRGREELNPGQPFSARGGLSPPPPPQTISMTQRRGRWTKPVFRTYGSLTDPKNVVGTRSGAFRRVLRSTRPAKASTPADSIRNLRSAKSRLRSIASGYRYEAASG